MNASPSLRKMNNFLPKFSIFIPAMCSHWIQSTHSFFPCSLCFEIWSEIWTLYVNVHLRHILKNTLWAVLEQHVFQFRFQDTWLHNIFHNQSVPVSSPAAWSKSVSLSLNFICLVCLPHKPFISLIYQAYVSHNLQIQAHFPSLRALIGLTLSLAQSWISLTASGPQALASLCAVSFLLPHVPLVFSSCESGAFHILLIAFI